ncbi:hypothetical protein [Pantoea sp. PSNIH1]|uniref:hypothetical protein n=1 Tax=Pantoea sp. PSNIH1 TaxID=1484158 RepID=UPI0011A9C7DF|nr:hypothetical protein [Pantoea sp. PSNIH1]
MTSSKTPSAIRRSWQVAAAADTGSNVLDVPLTPVSATPLRVQTWLIDAQGKTLAENQLELEVAPADAR